MLSFSNSVYAYTPLCYVIHTLLILFLFYKYTVFVCVHVVYIKLLSSESATGTISLGLIKLPLIWITLVPAIRRWEYCCSELVFQTKLWQDCVQPCLLSEVYFDFSNILGFGFYFWFMWLVVILLFLFTFILLIYSLFCDLVVRGLDL